MGRFRNERINVRLSDFEKEIFYKQMKRAGHKNVTDFIMTAICKHHSTVIDTSPILEIKGELNKIGCNVNQLAKVANSTRSIYADDVEELRGNLTAVRDLVKKAFQICVQSRKIEIEGQGKLIPPAAEKNLVRRLDCGVHEDNADTDKFTPAKAFDYIENPDKTTEKVYVSSYLCDSRTAVEDFREIQRLARNGGNNYAQHIIQSFSTEDKITPEKALEIGEELIRRMFPEHQYVIAVHSDTEHIHVHTILNSVNFYTHKKLRSNIGTVYKLRQISDELCAENGLIVIDKKFKDSRAKMKDAIDKAINESTSFYEFLGLMQRKLYEIRYDEHLSFKPYWCNQYFRVDTLGTAYKDIAIHRRCANHTEVENKRIQPYIKHFTPSTHKSRLKAKIDWGMRECKSFDELLEYLQKQGIEVKRGKHLAIKPKDGQRFRRIEKLGEQYTEEMLHLYFEDRERYSIRKAIVNVKNI